MTADIILHSTEDIAFTFVTNEERLLTINKDYSIEINPKLSITESAYRFWQILRVMNKYGYEVPDLEFDPVTKYKMLTIEYLETGDLDPRLSKICHELDRLWATLSPDEIKEAQAFANLTARLRGIR